MFKFLHSSAQTENSSNSSETSSEDQTDETASPVHLALSAIDRHLSDKRTVRESAKRLAACVSDITSSS